MKTAHVICCNDSVEAVVIGSELKANLECGRLEKKYYKKHPKLKTNGNYPLLYWHVHTVELIEK